MRCSSEFLLWEAGGCLQGPDSASGSFVGIPDWPFYSQMKLDQEGLCQETTFAGGVQHEKAKIWTDDQWERILWSDES